MASGSGLVCRAVHGVGSEHSGFARKAAPGWEEAVVPGLVLQATSCHPYRGHISQPPKARRHRARVTARRMLGGLIAF